MGNTTTSPRQHASDRTTLRDPPAGAGGRSLRTCRDWPESDFPDLITPAHLASLCLVLEMIGDRLERLAPRDDEPCSSSRRRRWTQAGAFLKAANTTMMDLMSPDTATGDKKSKPTRPKQTSSVGKPNQPPRPPHGTPT